jgi:Tfp pilus assembly protein PilO
MNLITPVILIIISIGTFFVYVNPNYRGDDITKPSVKILQAEHDSYQEALSYSSELRAKRNSLQATQQSFNLEQLNRLSELLPDNVDNIKLVIDIKNIAQKHNLVLKNIKIDTKAGTDTKKIGGDNLKYGTVGMTFGVGSSYDNFQNFIRDVEKSLRLIDVVDLSVTTTDTGLYDFSVGLKTYWLK